jgi:hypothetical protein
MFPLEKYHFAETNQSREITYQEYMQNILQAIHSHCELKHAWLRYVPHLIAFILHQIVAILCLTVHLIS